MTALNKYDRLESPGLWRATADAQRQDVVLSFGNATLVVSDKAGRALTHWSLPAIERINPGERPALFAPDTEQSETLEVADDTMIDALETVRKTILKRRPQPGRLRFAIFGGSIVFIGWLGLFWLPGALVAHANTVVPEVKRDQIGRDLTRHLTRITGRACSTALGDRALRRIAVRLGLPGDLRVVRATLPDTIGLPGGDILINARVVEDHEDPDVLAGYLLAEQARIAAEPALEQMLAYAGPLTSFRLLTQGEVPEATLTGYAEHLLAQTPALPDSTALLTRFKEAGLRSTSFAYAVDPSGETTLDLIEADPFPAGSEKISLSDQDWVSLQGICGE
ncbi:hypothetical protein [Cognatishimia sp. MH4019]|uniref:hypothetical protein n=1 Tax=Cognatishimia sp. MH4019 TaxID=2854030 RepID=UPI001CD292F5